MSALTLQQIFDTVAVHLLTQGKPSKLTNEYGETQCAYRGSGGRQCAVGVLIPDKYYDADMEGKTVEAVISSFSVPGLPRDPLSRAADLLSALQHLHDSFNPQDWRTQLGVVAINHKVSDAIMRGDR